MLLAEGNLRRKIQQYEFVARCSLFIEASWSSAVYLAVGVTIMPRRMVRVLVSGPKVESTVPGSDPLRVLLLDTAPLLGPQVVTGCRSAQFASRDCLDSQALDTCAV